MSATSSLDLLTWPVNSAEYWVHLYAEEPPAPVEIRVLPVAWRPAELPRRHPVAA